MAVIIGGTRAAPDRDDRLIGTGGDDIIFGDRHTAEVMELLPPEVPRVGGFLARGRGGDDRLEGRGGNDQLFGDAALITGTGRGGDDLLLGAGDDDNLIGDASIMEGNSRGGDDRIFGGIGTDSIFGDAGFATGDNAQGGDDRLDGGSRGDVLVGDTSFMEDDSRGGNDLLRGGSGDDLLYGDARAVNTFGEPGGSISLGDDVLTGGRGDDTLYGDTDPDPEGSDLTGVIFGADRFVLGPGDGRDTIVDFQAGTDEIDIRPYGTITSFAALDTNRNGRLETRDAAVDLGSEGLVLDLGAASGGTRGANTVTLSDVTALNASDLLIA
jgi:Ca2+-binding RTX toxin-like protein